MDAARVAALEALGGPHVPADEELTALVGLAAAIAGVPTATLNLLGADTQCMIATVGFEGLESPRPQSMCDQTIRQTGVMHVPDTIADPRFVANPWVNGELAAVRFYAAAPILTRDGYAIGTLCVFDDRPHHLSEQQLDQLVTLALLARALLERARDARRNQELAVVTEEGRDLLELALRELEERQEFTDAMLATVDVGIIAADADGHLTLFNRATRLWHGMGPVGDLDPAQFSQYYELFEADGITPLSPEDVPLLRALRDGHVEGAEVVIAPTGLPSTTVVCSGRSLSRDNGSPLGAFIAMTDVTRQRALEAQLRDLALHDALTGLPNRRLVMDRLEHALAAAGRDGTQVAVLFCDLNGFKAINDLHGHATGDDVIIAVAGRLSSCLRPGDTVGRLGGDEFVLICPNVPTESDLQTIASRITDRVAEPMIIRGRTHHLKVSVGTTTSRADTVAAALLEQADAAMYDSKQRSAIRL